MMLPPHMERGLANAARPHRTDPREAHERELAAVRREISTIGAALKNPLAWISLEILAIATDQRGPLERLRRLWFAEALLEAALAWHRSRGQHALDRELANPPRQLVTFAALVAGRRIELRGYADAPLEDALAFLLPACASTWRAWLASNGEDLDVKLELGTLELEGETIVAVAVE